MEILKQKFTQISNPPKNLIFPLASNTFEYITGIFAVFPQNNDDRASTSPALMGGGIAWFACALGAWQQWRNRSVRSHCEHSQSVPVRANHARKPSQPGML